MKFEKILISDVVHDAVHKVSPFAKEKNISIENTVEEKEVLGSRGSLNDLFSILLDNAIKYSPAGSTVKVFSKKSDSYIPVCVQDQGMGIEQKDLKHIFDRFYRADSTRSAENVSGYGLGLSIAKGIVDMHNGTISVTSELKKGTMFTVRLPKNQKKESK